MEAGPGLADSVAAELADVAYVLRLEPDVAFEYVSPSVEHLVGYTPAEHYADPALGMRLLDPRDADALAAATGMPVGEVVDFTVRWIARDGRTVWTQHRCRKVRREDGVVALYGAARDITGEREAVAELAAAEQRYRLLAENATDVVFAADNQGVLQWLSPSFGDVLGWAVSDWVGRPMRDLVHPEDLAKVSRKQRALLAGQPIRTRVRVRTRAGTYRWMDISASPLLDDGRAVIGRTGAWRDVHEQVEAERRYRLLAESASDIVFDVGTDDVYGWVSPSVQQVLGWDPRQIVGLSAQDLIHPDDLPEVLASRSAPVAGIAGVPRFRIRCADGTYRWMSGVSRQMHDEDGAFIGRAVGLRDIQDEVLAVTALAESEEHYRLLAANGFGVVMRLVHSAITWVSPSVADQLGWAPADLVGRRYDALVHPHDLPALHAAKDPIDAGEAVELRLRARTSHGTYLWTEVNAKPFLDSRGRPDGEVVSFRTVEHEVAVEQELERRARLDDLTGLLNRAEVLDKLDRVLGHSPRTGQEVAVAFADVDGFKAINDRHGHGAGDETLRVLAARTRDALRHDDLVARFGGDEILVVLVGVHGLDNAAQVVEEIRARATLPIPVLGGTIPATLSIGVTIARAGEDVDAVIARADQAMYEAKAAGKNTVVAR